MRAFITADLKVQHASNELVHPECQTSEGSTTKTLECVDFKNETFSFQEKYFQHGCFEFGDQVFTKHSLINQVG